MTNEEAVAILNTPKQGYVPKDEIAERTNQALNGDDQQLIYDGIVIGDFITEELPLIAKILDPLRRYRVLDVGCGYGRFAHFLAGFDCLEYIGIDPNHNRIEYADRQRGGRIAFLTHTPQTFLKSLPRFLKKFNFIYCRAVLQHLPLAEKLDTLIAMQKLLKPGGHLLIYDGRIMDWDLIKCAEFYQSDEAAKHMIPMPESMLLCSFCFIY
jgi:2-polyprenyl-3-methyl-5-hydroxy-6-metoxy-1,4-benzoquinol methylase